MPIYKYVAPERIQILENGSIRFTQAEALNDPWELRPDVDRLVPTQALDEIQSQVLSKPKEEILKALEKYAADAEAELLAAGNPASKDEIKAQLRAELESDPNAFAEALKEVLGAFDAQQSDLFAGFPVQITKHFGVLSLAQSRENRTMWAGSSTMSV